MFVESLRGGGGRVDRVARWPMHYHNRIPLLEQGTNPSQPLARKAFLGYIRADIRFISFLPGYNCALLARRRVEKSRFV